MDTPNPSLETISWEIAWQAVHAVLPDAAHMTPGSLLATAEKAGKQVHVTAALDIGANMSDCSILQKLLVVAKPNETVIAITDRSFLAGGAPFAFRTSCCEAFADAYFHATGEVVVSGSDVVFVCPESKLIVLYHHEGHAAVVRK